MYDFRPSIGIIGLGIVGNAVAKSYETLNLVIIDPEKGFNKTYKDIKECEGIFVCVPSPTLPNGKCDVSILESVLKSLEDYTGVIISKVTATPDIYEGLQLKYPNLVYVPEFLTAQNAIEDYRREDWAIIGGKILAYQHEAARIIRYAKKDLRVCYSTIGEAALYKYTVNSFLATKVVFMNEMHELAEKNGYNWGQLKHMMLFDTRIGTSHTSVPGHDGYYGFGGMCFPKDTAALLTYAENQGVELNVLNNAVKKNTILRLKKS
jgi:UDPglucose 6-dehydrogenase